MQTGSVKLQKRLCKVLKTAVVLLQTFLVQDTPFMFPTLIFHINILCFRLRQEVRLPVNSETRLLTFVLFNFCFCFVIKDFFL